MSTTRYASVLGLGFGDCGKGHFVDALARRWQAHTVVRFNGGAQAGHNVVTPADAHAEGKHHTFSQFGAGTFVPGVQTLLLDPVVVHPTALLVEAEVLGRIGIHDALSRLSIDARCKITTPFHQAAGRLRELLRGVASHGTCGVGVGETVRHALEHPGQELRYAALAETSTSRPKALLERLQAIRETLLAEFSPQCPNGISGALAEEFQMLKDETLAARWMAAAQALARQCPPGFAEAISSQLMRPGCVVFEGAQGVLLDAWRGFYPHTTWSSISTAAVEAAAAPFGISAPIEHYGVLRTYLTRHGNGPLPTHDESLDRLLPEPHNQSTGWQGHFRRGHPDAVLLRYALESVGDLSGLLISHLDIFQRGFSLRWCERYAIAASSNFPRFVERLPLSKGEDISHQLALTKLLERARPNYSSTPIQSALAFLEHLTGVTRLPVALCSYGAACDEVRVGSSDFRVNVPRE